MTDKYLRWIEQHNMIASTLSSMRKSEVDYKNDMVADCLESDKMQDATSELSTAATLRHN